MLIRFILVVVFSIINHGSILDKLSELERRDTALHWFCFYLDDQFQMTVPETAVQSLGTCTVGLFRTS